MAAAARCQGTRLLLLLLLLLRAPHPGAAQPRNARLRPLAGLGAHPVDGQETPCHGPAAPGAAPAHLPPACLSPGALSCGAHTPRPATAPELRASRSSPRRERNFGSPAALREAAESVPWPRAEGGPHRRAWGQRESRSSPRGSKETDAGPQPAPARRLRFLGARRTSHTVSPLAFAQAQESRYTYIPYI